MARVRGGGHTGQSQAVRHGIARALQNWDPSLRPALKAAGAPGRPGPGLSSLEPLGVTAGQTGAQAVCLVQLNGSPVARLSAVQLGRRLFFRGSFAEALSGSQPARGSGEDPNPQLPSML